ncbi:MAG: hypothetical protein IJX76_08120 [Clostridia bacterium]|nr:hypothetical protein [Clostridia bacterium]
MKLKPAKKRMLARIVFFLISSTVVFALLCGLIAAYIALSVWIHGFSFSDSYTYKMGMESTAERRLETITYEMGDVGDESVLYINFTALQKYCGFYESGDRKVHRYILPSDCSEFTVTVNSTRVDLNGSIIHMEAPAVVKGDSLYLPLSFIDHYIGGITVENAVSESESDESGKTEETVDEYTYIIRCSDKGEYSLLLSDNAPCPPIDRSVLD